jgi:hypothetical protein
MLSKDEDLAEYMLKKILGIEVYWLDPHRSHSTSYIEPGESGRVLLRTNHEVGSAQHTSIVTKFYGSEKRLLRRFSTLER